MDTFTPPIPPQVNNTQLEETPRARTNDFGDGYQTDLPDGLNNDPGKVTLQWSTLNWQDATTIHQFMRNHVAQPFWYTLPRETTPRAWITGPVQRSYPWPLQDSITVSLIERFVL
jgi:phage-related protein